MSVTYIIYPGYDCGDRENAWLKRIADSLDLDRIKTIALELRCPLADQTGVTLDDYIDAYRSRTDLTITYDDEYQPYPEDDRRWFAIRQSASGGGKSRDMKERLRKAVTIYLLTEAAKVGINLNVKAI